VIRYGKQSRGNIEELCSPLQVILHKYADVAPRSMDLTIICGHRGEVAQNKAFDSGVSSVTYPNSKHNSMPSEAFDFVPAPLGGPKGWSDLYRFSRIAGGLEMVATQLGFKIRWGGDWDRDGATIDQKFKDLGHIEFLGAL
jgi:peptidoglycan L-alanyl-D-glutamate endopeptidase CwlK